MRGGHSSLAVMAHRCGRSCRPSALTQGLYTCQYTCRYTCQHKCLYTRVRQCQPCGNRRRATGCGGAEQQRNASARPSRVIARITRLGTIVEQQSAGTPLCNSSNDSTKRCRPTGLKGLVDWFRDLGSRCFNNLQTPESPLSLADIQKEQQNVKRFQFEGLVNTPTSPVTPSFRPRTFSSDDAPDASMQVSETTAADVAQCETVSFVVAVSMQTNESQSSPFSGAAHYFGPR